MPKVPIYLEVGSKKVFASAADWPGWCRAARSEEAALEALAEYAERYAPVARRADLSLPASPTFTVVERLRGTTTTDFGAPDVAAQAEAVRLTAAPARRQAALVAAAWAELDDIAARVSAHLRKGPRGGGRDRDPMLQHVLNAEAAYARKIGVRVSAPAVGDLEAIEAMREAILAALAESAPAGPLIEKGWSSRYAARRIAWHVLDHAWEMQDKTER